MPLVWVLTPVTFPADLAGLFDIGTPTRLRTMTDAIFAAVLFLTGRNRMKEGDLAIHPRQCFLSRGKHQSERRQRPDRETSVP